MIAKQEKIRNCPVNRVVSARDKAIFALRDFVDEELRAMESPFLLHRVQELGRGYLIFFFFLFSVNDLKKWELSIVCLFWFGSRIVYLCLIGV